MSGQIDASEVFNQYKRLKAVPRKKTPNIHPLNADEASRLEQAIVNELKISIDKAKRKPIRYHPSLKRVPPA